MRAFVVLRSKPGEQRHEIEGDLTIAGAFIEAGTPMRARPRGARLEGGGIPIGEGGRIVRVGDVLQAGDEEIAIEATELTESIPTRELALDLANGVIATHAGWHVEIVEGPNEGAAIALEDGIEVAVGRDPSSRLFIEHETVSRNHCTIVRHGDEVWIEDRGATRGTFLGPARLSPRRAAQWPERMMARVGDAVLALRPPVDRRIDAIAKGAKEGESVNAPTLQEKADPPASLPPREGRHDAGIARVPAVHAATPASRPTLVPVIVWISAGLILASCVAAFAWILLAR